jgi:hypothetical protein
MSFSLSKIAYCTCRGLTPSSPATNICTTYEVIHHLLLVSGQRSLRGYPNWSATCRNPETRKWWFEIQEGQETGAICNRHATHVDDRSYRVPDRCYHATHLGQGQSPHRGTASIISLTGLKFDEKINIFVYLIVFMFPWKFVTCTDWNHIN